MRQSESNDQIRRQVSESEELYRLIAEHSTDMISKHTPEGVYTYASPACHSLLGYQSEELVGCSAYDFFHPQDLDAIRKSHSTILEMPDVSTVEYRIRRKDCSYTWFETTSKTVRDEETGEIREIIAVSRDITERKRGEDETFFQARLLDEVQAAVIATDLDGVVTHWNAHAERLYGYSCEEVLGHNISGLTVGPAEASIANEIMERLRDGESWEGDFTVRKKDGSTFTAYVINSLVHDAQGQAVGVVGVSTDITERKRVAQELRESEERFRVTFEQAAVGVAHNALDGRWLRVNRKLCEILGYSREELLQRAFQDITHPDDVEPNLGYLRQLFAGEIGSFSMEKRYIRKDGSIVWGELTVSLVRKSSGEPGYLISVVEDITGRKRTEEALRESREALRKSEEFHRFAVEAGRIGTWDLNLQTEECLISPKMTELMGFSPNQTIVPVPQWREAIVPDDRTLMAAALDASIESDTPLDLEFRVGLKDGTERWLYSRGGVSRDASGKALRVHGASIDVTERKRNEEDLRRSNRRIVNILESITDAFFAVDREWRFTYVNRQAEGVLERSRDELLNKNLWEEFPEAVGSMFYEKYHEAVTYGSPIHFETFYPPLGIWVEVHAYPTSGEGLAVYFQDITERKKAEKALLEIREAERRRIARDLHDTVLQDLSGALQALQAVQVEFESADHKADLSRETDALRRAAKGLRGTVHDLRHESEQSFVTAVESLVEYNRQATPERQIRLSVQQDFPRELPEQVKVELLRMVQEALTNARRHSGARWTGVRLRKDQNEVCVEVIDDGVGFNPESVRGGLGLLGMRERIASIDGELMVRSDRNKGTALCVTVPAHVLSGEEIRHAGSPE